MSWKETIGYKRSRDSGSGGPERKQRKGQKHQDQKGEQKGRESRPAIEMRTQRGVSVRARKSREQHYSPYIVEEQGRSSSKNTRGSSQQNRQERKGGQNSNRSISLEVLVGDVNCKLFKKGISYREIAKIVGRSHSCVQKIIGRFKSDGLIENKSGRGRKSILSDVAKRKVLKDIKIDPKLSVVKVAAETSRIKGRCVSAETVRNLIRHAGYSSRVARKKLFISLQNQEKRLEFTKTHQLKTDNFWKKVIFSDESKFNFLEVMAVAPFGESRTPFWIQKIYVLQLNMVVAPSWFGVVWLLKWGRKFSFYRWHNGS
ncbi:HTH_Tnp_Tc3_2 domain-containing protein [Trichonephila clavipes]|nr:HTH_Tnp_Tc3_2 domain-containing protein [Trichonephila clavipes]